MLLTTAVSRTATSFEELKSTTTRDASGQPVTTVWNTYREACAAHGLLQTDDEWVKAMRQGALTMLPPAMRGLFATLLIYTELHEPQKLFNDFCDQMGEDFPVDLSVELRGALVRLDLLDRLPGRVRDSYPWLQVPEAVEAELGLARRRQDVAALLGEAVDLSDDARSVAFAAAVPALQRMLPSQLQVVSTVLAAIGATSAIAQAQGPAGFAAAPPAPVRPLIAFWDAPAGTGKTTCANAVIDAAEADGKVVIRVASTGIAAIQLRGGRTFHSRFAAPIHPDAGSFFSVVPGTPTHHLIQEADLIIWDEAPYMHRHLLEGLDRTLRDICGSRDPFGGKSIVLAGDFRQVLPVVKHGNAAAVMKASMRKSTLWPHFQVLSLTENMRVLGRFAGDPRAVRWAEWLLQIGNGQLDGTPGPNAYVKDVRLRTADWPDLIEDSVEDMVQFVFPGLGTLATPPQPGDMGTILTPHNATVNLLNAAVYRRFPGEEVATCSADSVCSGVDTPVPTEVLNSYDAPTMPPHRLCLKPGMPITLLRNLDPTRGLMNGTLLIFRKLIDGVLLECERADDSSIKVHLSRIPIDPPDDAYEIPWKRRQFPVKAAFAMTINKSQGKTLNRVGLYLRLGCFGHGQLYVALSRVGHPDHIRVCFYDEPVDEDADAERQLRQHTLTPNVVYRPALIAAT
jgi:hypothetical protein